jgi:hypothetical protein
MVIIFFEWIFLGAQQKRESFLISLQIRNV